MSWTIKYDANASKSLKKIAKNEQKRILNFLNNRVANLDNPRIIGQALKGDLGNYWKYRVGDYRIITQIKDKDLIILALELGNRKDIYQKFKP